MFHFHLPYVSAVRVYCKNAFNFFARFFSQKQEAAKREQRRREQTEAMKNEKDGGKVAELKQSAKSVVENVKVDAPKIGNEAAAEKSAPKSKKRNKNKNKA